MEYLEEIKELIEKYKDKGFEFGKEIDYLEKRNSCRIDEIKQEVISLADLKYIERPGERR